MHRYLIAGLLLSIGAVAYAGGAEAQSSDRYCYENPGDPDCDASDFDPDPGYGDDGGYDEPGYAPPPRRRPVYGGGSGYCQRLGRGLRQFGYRDIRPSDCEGKYFEYIARQGRSLYTVKIRSSSGRVAGRQLLRR
jgi:hypothetical protein